jgi:exonuclease SbcC
MLNHCYTLDEDMIPLRVHIKNFLSYGSELQVIDFGLYPLICLSGKNGHGKSALLDAITWALWGQARKIGSASKADEGLLRLGQTQMLVMLDFYFNKQTYRVRRELTLTYGKTYATLDFGILHQEKKQITPLTDKTIRATQEIIDTTLGLNFESFINSAFLRQGHSNEFSKKSPKERKEILATILGLDRFEALRKTALEKIKQTTDDRTHLMRIMEHIGTELAQATTLTTDLTTIHEKLATLTMHEQMLYRQGATLVTEKNVLIKQQQKAALITYQITTKKQEQQTLHEKLRFVSNQWKTTHRLQLQATDRHLLETEKNVLVHQLAEQQSILQKNLTLQQAYTTAKEVEHLFLKQRSDEYRAHHHEKQLTLERLNLTKKSYEVQISSYQKQAQDLYTDLNANRHEQHILQERLGELVDLKKTIEVVELNFERRKSYYHRYITQGNFITQEIAQLEQKQQLSHDDDNPSCPLCEQNLSASRKRFLKAKFSKQQEFLHHRHHRLTRLVAALKKILIEQHAQLNQLKHRYEEFKKLEIKIGELRKIEEKTNSAYQMLQNSIKTGQLQQLPTLDTLTALHEELKQLPDPTVLAQQDPHYQSLQQTRQALEYQLQQLLYNENHHQALIVRHAWLEQELKKVQDLQEAAALQQQRKEHIHEIITALRNNKQDCSTLLEQEKQFSDVHRRLQKISSQEEQHAMHTQQHMINKENLLQEKGALENQQQKIVQWQETINRHRLQVDAITCTIEEYQMLAHALSKDGIQALLIEEAIPEIEQEANYLLAKLTDNQAHIFIESLRDLKKGGTKETLDIKISDATGIRPYELFSGGEAFRIDFSLRIAISKLLARRAGTSLQTLIIDEGFGSQDEEGLSHIMEVLYKVQDDFAKIIIVSHLPSMKDKFPVHFLINKGPQGSTVHIMEYS